MINLWLDDIRDPARFRPGEEWHWCKTNTEFIRALDTMPMHIGKIALDHDKSHMCKQTDLRKLLGIEPGEESLIDLPITCDETYEPSVRYMALWAAFHDLKDVPVEIITSNVDAPAKYKDILTDRFIVTVNQGGAQKKH
jgi:hypothetical protein